MAWTYYVILVHKERVSMRDLTGIFMNKRVSMKVHGARPRIFEWVYLRTRCHGWEFFLKETIQLGLRKMGEWRRRVVCRVGAPTNSWVT